MANILVWDLETIPDLKGFAAANGHDGKTEDEIREALGDKFPKHIYHSIVCIGALIARQDGERWIVDALGAPWAFSLGLQRVARAPTGVRRAFCLEEVSGCVDRRRWCKRWT
jgi:hypothetical protein